MLLFPTLHGYVWQQQLVPDIVAGVAVATLAIPQGISNALLAGLPPQYGLYGVVQIGYPLLGYSPNLVVGPVAITALLTSAAIKDTGIMPMTDEWITACAFMSLVVGAYQVVFSCFHLAPKVMGIMSEATTKAFSAVGVLSLLKAQLRDIFGASDHERLLSETNPVALEVFIISIIVLELSRYKGSRAGSLIVIILGCLFVHLSNSDRIPTVGAIPAGLPKNLPLYTILSLPEGTQLRTLFWGVPVAFVSFTEAFVVANIHADLDPDRELRAVGFANIFTSFLGSYPVSGSFSRTAVNIINGGTSVISHISAGVTVGFVLTALSGWLSFLPRSCIAAIVVSATARLVDRKYFLKTLSSGNLQATVTYFLVLFVGIAFGVDIGLATGIVFDLLLNAITKNELTKGE